MSNDILRSKANLPLNCIDLRCPLESLPVGVDYFWLRPNFLFSVFSNNSWRRLCQNDMIVLLFKSICYMNTNVHWNNISKYYRKILYQLYFVKYYLLNKKPFKWNCTDLKNNWDDYLINTCKHQRFRNWHNLLTDVICHQLTPPTTTTPL